MPATAKIFSTGNSQAVRLPKAFRVDAREMWIAKNELTGEITLKPKDDITHKEKLELLFKLIRENPLPDDFLAEETRRNEPPRHPFADWSDNEAQNSLALQKPAVKE